MSTPEEDRLEAAINKFATAHLRWLVICAFGVGIWMARMEYIYSRLADSNEWQRKADAAEHNTMMSRIASLEKLLSSITGKP